MEKQVEKHTMHVDHVRETVGFPDVNVYFRLAAGSNGQVSIIPSAETDHFIPRGLLLCHLNGSNCTHFPEMACNLYTGRSAITMVQFLQIAW